MHMSVRLEGDFSSPDNPDAMHGAYFLHARLLSEFRRFVARGGSVSCYTLGD